MDDTSGSVVNSVKAMRVSSLLTFVVCFFASFIALSDAKGPVRAGVLDQPLPNSKVTLRPGQPIMNSIANAAGNPVALQQALRDKFSDEQDELEKLPRPELQERAKKGERGAQVTLAADFAREAAQLAFAPAAANDALSDAVRWYSLAAKRGFPGAPSLDQAGVKYYPIRVHRSR